MFIDKNTLLSGSDGVAQTLAAAASDYSDDFIDLENAFPALASGNPLVLRCVSTASFAANVGAKVTMELRAFPVLQSAVEVTAIAITTATDLLTKANHGFVDGQHLRIKTLTTSTLSGGNATTLDFFVINPTKDTFKIALTPGGASVTFSGSNGSCVVDIQHVTLASTGPIPIAMFRDETLVTCSTNPVTQATTPTRYVYAHFESSAGNFSAGSCLLDVAHDSGEGSAPFVFHKSGFTVE